MASNKNKVKIGLPSSKKMNRDSNGVDMPQIADVAELEMGNNGNGSTSALMNQVESVLSRIKSEMDSGESISGRIFDSVGERERFNSGDLQESTTNTIGLKIKSVRAELERRQSLLQAQVVDAEKRAREAEELYKLAEAKYEDEHLKRGQLEQDLSELDSKYNQLSATIESEELKRIEAEYSGQETLSSLKQAEDKLLEYEMALIDERKLRFESEESLRSAEAKFLQVSSVLTSAELKLDVFESKSEAIEVALSELERKREDAERKAESASTSQDELKALLELSESDVSKYKQEYEEASLKLKLLEDKFDAAERSLSETHRQYNETQRKYEELSYKLDNSESKLKADRNDAMKMELLLQEAQEIAATASERFKGAEALLHKETELRFAAERKLKAMENELSSYLDIDLNTGSLPPLSEITSGAYRRDDSAPQYAVISSHEVEAELQEKQAMVESEKEARRVAEDRAMLLEEELLKLDDRHRAAESELKKVVLKQEMQLRSIKEHTNTLRPIAPTQQGTTSLRPPRATSVVGANAYKHKLTFIGYGAFMMLLLVTLIWLLYQIVVKYT